jgi:hypothetical protein
MRPVWVAKTLNSKISSETARRNRDRIAGVPEASPGIRAIAWLARIHTYLRMESGPAVSELISGVVAEPKTGSYRQSGERQNNPNTGRSPELEHREPCPVLVQTWCTLGAL